MNKENKKEEVTKLIQNLEKMSKKVQENRDGIIDKIDEFCVKLESIKKDIIGQK